MSYALRVARRGGRHFSMCTRKYILTTTRNCSGGVPRATHGRQCPEKSSKESGAPSASACTAAKANGSQFGICINLQESVVGSAFQKPTRTQVQSWNGGAVRATRGGRCQTAFSKGAGARLA